MTKPTQSVFDEEGNYEPQSAGWSEVCTFTWDGKKWYGQPICSECGWRNGDHRAFDDACPAIPYEAALK